MIPPIFLAVQSACQTDSTIILESKDRTDSDVVDLLRSAQKSVFICVHSLNDPLLTGEISRERERGVKVVVSLHPMKLGSQFGVPEIGYGEMIVDATYEWFGSRDWSLDRYSNSSIWFQLSRKDRKAWTNYFK